MDVRVYEVFLQFNLGLDQALRSLDIPEKLALESPGCITKIRVNLSELRCYAKNHFASKDIGRDGRTSTHDPRLLTTQQSLHDEQVSSSNTGAEALGARKTGGCHLAGRFAVGEQINFDSIVEAEERVCWTFEERAADGVLLGLVDPNGPRFFSGSSVTD